MKGDSKYSIRLFHLFSLSNNPKFQIWIPMKLLQKISKFFIPNCWELNSLKMLFWIERKQPHSLRTSGFLRSVLLGLCDSCKDCFSSPSLQEFFPKMWERLEKQFLIRKIRQSLPITDQLLVFIISEVLQKAIYIYNPGDLLSYVSPICSNTTE